MLRPRSSRTIFLHFVARQSYKKAIAFLLPPFFLSSPEIARLPGDLSSHRLPEKINWLQLSGRPCRSRIAPIDCRMRAVNYKRDTPVASDVVGCFCYAIMRSPPKMLAFSSSRPVKSQDRSAKCSARISRARARAENVSRVAPTVARIVYHDARRATWETKPPC
jgi:hypothetical protein